MLFIYKFFPILVSILHLFTCARASILVNFIIPLPPESAKFVSIGISNSQSIASMEDYIKELDEKIKYYEEMIQMDPAERKAQRLSAKLEKIQKCKLGSSITDAETNIYDKKIEILKRKIVALRANYVDVKAIVEILKEKKNSMQKRESQEDMKRAEQEIAKYAARFRLVPISNFCHNNSKRLSYYKQRHANIFEEEAENFIIRNRTTQLDTAGPEIISENPHADQPFHQLHWHTFENEQLAEHKNGHFSRFLASIAVKFGVASLTKAYCQIELDSREIFSSEMHILALFIHGSSNAATSYYFFKVDLKEKIHVINGTAQVVAALVLHETNKYSCESVYLHEKFSAKRKNS